MGMRVTVLGGGSWGTTVASVAAHNADAVLWCRNADVAGAINDRHENPRYLAGYELHGSLRATTSLDDAVSAADVLVVGVPSQHFRSVLEQAAPSVRPWVPVVSLTKGLEHRSRLRMSEVANEVLPGHPAGALTGPNLAKEVLEGHAAATVVAMTDPVVAEKLQRVFAVDRFRVYTNHDVVGSELGGALKNVVAIAAGMADGLGAGDNTRAAVITRGLAELTRLGVAMGGEQATFAGLAGMGDLLATCLSKQSRNRHVGEQLGMGKTIDQVIAEMDQVAEGVKTVPVVMELAADHEIEMPIAYEISGVIAGTATAADAYAGLLRRQSAHESQPAR